MVTITPKTLAKRKCRQRISDTTRILLGILNRTCNILKGAGGCLTLDRIDTPSRGVTAGHLQVACADVKSKGKGVTTQSREGARLYSVPSSLNTCQLDNPMRDLLVESQRHRAIEACESIDIAFARAVGQGVCVRTSGP